MNNIKASDNFLEEKKLQSQVANHHLDLKKCRTEKMPTICLTILDTFLGYNIAEINETILINHGNMADQSFLGNVNLQSQATSRDPGYTISETKYYQILKAQSLKLKNKSCFRHVLKILSDLRDKVSASQSSEDRPHLAKSPYFDS